MIFVLAGNPDNKNFALATLTASFLKVHLPNFEYVSVSKLSDEWKDYLFNLNKENKWNVSEQPIIWMEFVTGGKKYLLGGLSEFYEYCYEYYGIEIELLDITERTILQTIDDNMKHHNEAIISKEYCGRKSKYVDVNKKDIMKMMFKNMKEYKKNQITYLSPKRTIISILGGMHDITEYLLQEMMQLNCLYGESGLEVRLFDKTGSEKSYRNLNNIAYSQNTQGILGNKPFVKPVKTLEASISECDILLLILDFKVAKKGMESRRDILIRVMKEAETISVSCNKYAKRTLRIVVFNFNSPNCFFANYLTHRITTINKKNVVVPTSYSGMKLLSLLSKETGVKLENLSAPPIWGADEINMYFDMRAILYKGHVCKPFKRSLNTPPSSTLPLGVVETELRFLSHLISDEEALMKEYKAVKHRKKWVLRFPTVFAKVRCIMDILRIWYEPDHESIISLGVCSNGTFGLPKGIVLSQPSSLQHGHFAPCPDYPVSDDTLKIVNKIGMEVNDIVRQYIIEPEETFF